MIPEELKKEALRPNLKVAPKSRSVEDAIRNFLDQARRTSWDSTWDMRALENSIQGEKYFGVKGDSILHRLILNIKPRSETESSYSLWADRPDDAPGTSDGSVMKNGVSGPDDRGLGTRLLLWMMKNKKLSKCFTGVPKIQGGKEKNLDDLPIHLAISENKYFLRCFLGLYYHPDSTESVRELIRSTIGQKRPSGYGNCIHTAIENQTPFASTFVAVCSDRSLLDTDKNGFTPLHLSLMMKPGPKMSIPSQPASFASLEPKPCWSDTFSAAQFFKEVQIWKDESLLVDILKTANNNGVSCLQTAYNNREATNDTFRKDLKSLIFEKIETIEDARKALYGVAGKPKELFLNMSDFNQMSHDFENYVEKMTSDIPAEKMVDLGKSDVSIEKLELEANGFESSVNDMEWDTTIAFEETLFFVNLPDLNHVKQPCQHSTIQKLFRWLHMKNVKTIKKLKIPDSTTNPLCEAFVQHHILDVFKIEALDWRKLDINLDIIPTSACSKTLSDLALYSSGNWSVLYHWKSEDGLKSLTNLRSVRINIIRLNPSKDYHDADTRKRYYELTEGYKDSLDKAFRAPEVPFHAEIETEADWDYPLSQVGMEDHESRGVKHKFISELLPSSDVLRQWDDDINDDDTDDWEDEKERFKEYALPPKEALSEDKRIRVAIIDNGADRIRSQFRHMIAQGNSYVTENDWESKEPLPWWMVSDPHGTQMASLVSQANRFCRLYIARVGKMRDDINPAKAAEAIKWAIGLKVDIISISWTIDRKDEMLQNAITEAVNNRILIFCSTSDRGIYSDAWPVNHPGVISVSATDKYGHLTSKTMGMETADIRIPGDNIPVKLGNATPSVSGSSVATALAAGIASLALLLLRIFNETLPDSGPMGTLRHKYYTKQGMMEVFRKMGKQGQQDTAIMLSRMFPEDSGDDEKIRKSLVKNWCIANWDESR